MERIEKEKIFIKSVAGRNSMLIIMPEKTLFKAHDTSSFVSRQEIMYRFVYETECELQAAQVGSCCFQRGQGKYIFDRFLSRRKLFLLFF